MPNNPEAPASLHPDTFPLDKFPELYEKRPVRELTAEEIAAEEAHLAQQRAAAAERTRNRHENCPFPAPATDWADTRVFDDETIDMPNGAELQRRFAVLMQTLTREIGDRAPEDVEFAIEMINVLQQVANEKLASHNWQPQPLYARSK